MPPLFGNSGYGPGTSYTTTGGADYGPAQMAQALLAREGDFLSRRAAAPRPAQPPVGGGFGAGGGEGRAYVPPAEQSRGEGENLSDVNFRKAQQRDALLRMQARQNPAPTRLVSGPQIIPGTVMDPNAMNSYQREAYLPSGASFTPTSYTASQALTADREAPPFDPYAGRRLEGPGIAMGPGADFARRQMANAAGRR